ncbi:MAG: hypothetical protein U9N49_11425 [Campylobacterota bacterium]|nr:hypothetical protein [Campylobacterota bacterium]
MIKFIKLGLLLSALLIFVGCGSEAPGAYDGDDTKPSATAFTQGELSNKRIYMSRSDLELIIIFYNSTEFEIQTIRGLMVEVGEYSINDDGSLTIGTLNYKRESIESTTFWRLLERTDIDGDGEWDTSNPVTWSLESMTQTMAFSLDELDGQEIYILNDDANEKRIFGPSSYMGSFHIGDASEPYTGTYLVNYSISSSGSIVTQWGSIYTRVSIENNVWYVKESQDIDGDGIVDSTSVETWYTQEPSNFYE